MSKKDRSRVVSLVQEPASRHYSIAPSVVRLAVVCMGAFLLVLSLLSVHYYQMWERSSDFEAVQERLELLHNDHEKVRVKTKQLSERLSSMEVAAQKLRVMTGLDMDGLGGVGGPAANDLEVFFDEKSLLDQLNSLEKKSISLREELRKFQEYYKDRSILLSATPSIMPVIGYPSGRFGMRRDPFTGNRSFHPGLDLSAPVGSKVIATADGVVRFAGRQLNYGKLVKIEHRFGLTTRYGHLKESAVKRGQVIRKGDVIGYVGATGRATGPHVHYEVRLNGRSLNPLRFFRDHL